MLNALAANDPGAPVQQPFECGESCKCNLQSEGRTGNGLISELLAPHHQVVTTCHYPKHQLTRTHKLTRAFWHFSRRVTAETSMNPRKHTSFPYQSISLTARRAHG